MSQPQKGAGGRSAPPVHVCIKWGLSSLDERWWTDILCFPPNFLWDQFSCCHFCRCALLWQPQSFLFVHDWNTEDNETTVFLRFTTLFRSVSDSNSSFLRPDIMSDGTERRVSHFWIFKWRCVGEEWCVLRSKWIWMYDTCMVRFDESEYFMFSPYTSVQYESCTHEFPDLYFCTKMADLSTLWLLVNNLSLKAALNRTRVAPHLPHLRSVLSCMFLDDALLHLHVWATRVQSLR